MSPDLSALARAERLRIVSRSLAEGVYEGRHGTPHRGGAGEPDDARPYTPGDPLHRVDWRLFGRTDKLYTRTQLREGQLTVVLAVDASASMGFASLPNGTVAPTKFDRAASLAGAIASLTLEHGDRVGVVVSSTGKLEPAHSVQVSGGASALDAVLDALAQTIPGGRRGIASSLARVPEVSPNRGLVVAIGDGLEPIEPLARAAGALRWSSPGGVGAAGWDIVFLQVLADDELAPPPTRASRFTDPESGRSSPAVDACTDAHTPGGYRDRLSMHNRRLVAALTATGARYTLHRTGADPITALRAALR